MDRREKTSTRTFTWKYHTWPIHVPYNSNCSQQGSASDLYFLKRREKFGRQSRDLDLVAERAMLLSHLLRNHFWSKWLKNYWEKKIENKLHLRWNHGKKKKTSGKKENLVSILESMKKNVFDHEFKLVPSFKWRIRGLNHALRLDELVEVLEAKFSITVCIRLFSLCSFWTTKITFIIIFSTMIKMFNILFRTTQNEQNKTLQKTHGT